MKPLRKVHRQLTRPDGTKVWVWVPFYGPPAAEDPLPDLSKPRSAKKRRQQLGRAVTAVRKW